jgi:ABC-type arginine/histidine transport system permease subunit
LIDLYLYFIRGAPFLIQLFLIYYGSGQISWINNSFLGSIFSNAFLSGLIALTINSTAYTTALFYGGLQNFNRDQLVSAQACGLTSWQIFIHIMLPSLFYRIFPAYINEMIMVLKCSALVSTITVLDITGTAQEIISDSYQSLNILFIAAVLYILIALLLAVPARIVYTYMFNKRFNRI